MHLISVQSNKDVLCGINIQHNSYLCFFLIIDQWNSCQHYYMGFAECQYVYCTITDTWKNVIM